MTTDYALRGITIVDGRGGVSDPNQTLVIRRGKIAAVLTATDSLVPEGLEVLDLAGMWVMPGMIDAHVHLAGGRASVTEQELGTVAEPKQLRAMRSVYEAQAILKRGFTAVRDVSWNGLYLKRLFIEQTIPGPKVISAGPGLTRTGGHADMYQYTSEYGREHGPWGLPADGPHEIVKAVRTLLREGADAIKIFASGGDNWPHDRNSDSHYSMEELRAAVDEAHRQTGTIVMCHAENRQSILDAIHAGVDTIEHGEDLDDEIISLMVERGIILVPTLELIVNWNRDFMPMDAPEPVRTPAFLYRDKYIERNVESDDENSKRSIESFQRALAAGVRIALGSDTVFEPLTPYGEYSARELGALVEHGMTTSQAIIAATSVAADALGMGHLIGSIEVGKQADLLVVRENPTVSPAVLYNAQNIHLTFCDGRLTVTDGRLVW